MSGWSLLGVVRCGWSLLGVVMSGWPLLGVVMQGWTEEFGEGGVQYEFDEGAGQEVTLPRGLGLNPRIFCITRSVFIEKIY